MTVAAKGSLADRFALLVPKHVTSGQRVRLLVALHGKGESTDPALGLRAWLELYGLSAAYARLLAPPVVRTQKRRDVTDETLARINASLAAKPFAGVAVACPFTPNLASAKDPARAQRDYADWLVDAVIPAARKLAPVGSGPSFTAVDGCSMGGPFALETFLQHPDVFGSVGVVQPAFGAHRAPGFAQRIEEAVRRVGPRPIHLLTSEGDPFSSATKALGAALAERKVPSQLEVFPGPHDQPWLREAGTLAMLLFHERPA
jgi:hypothetical protein